MVAALPVPHMSHRALQLEGREPTHPNLCRDASSEKRDVFPSARSRPVPPMPVWRLRVLPKEWRTPPGGAVSSECSRMPCVHRAHIWHTVCGFSHWDIVIQRKAPPANSCTHLGGRTKKNPSPEGSPFGLRPSRWEEWASKLPLAEAVTVGCCAACLTVSSAKFESLQPDV